MTGRNTTALLCLVALGAMGVLARGQSGNPGAVSKEGGQDTARSRAVAVGPLAPRLPISSDEAAEQSLSRLREVFSDEFALSTTPRKEGNLANRLAAQVAMTEDPIDRWMLLSEALLLATDAGDAGIALPITERIPFYVDLERNGRRLKRLLRIAGKSTPAATREVGEAALELARDADEAGDHAVATKAITLASSDQGRRPPCQRRPPATKPQGLAKDLA